MILFARYAELLGATRIDVPASVGDSIRAIVSHIRALPGGSALPADPFVTVNLEKVDLDYRPSPGDEIGLLPPMAGG